ncbi:MAG: MBL fold metallo-hydrolase [bacterium]|nr:MBL fold metallo-hydrolase [bacterium]
MKLTILGHTAPFPAPGRACPGYLVEEGSTRLLLDAGNGVLERMLAHCRYEDLTAVVASHLHFDHFADLLVLRYAIDVCRALGDRRQGLPVYAPAGPAGLPELLTYKEATRWVPATAGEAVDVGDLRVSFVAVDHPIPTHAVIVEGERGRLAYSGDSRWGEGLIQAAQGADLLLCEATFQDRDRHLAAPTGHLTATEAARVADRAGAGRLVLTHIQAFYDREVSLAEAQAVAGGPVELAEEGRVYHLG